MEDKIGTNENVPKENRNGPPTGFEFIGDKDRVTQWSNAQDIMMFSYLMLHWADQTVQVKFIDAQSSNI